MKLKITETNQLDPDRFSLEKSDLEEFGLIIKAIFHDRVEMDLKGISGQSAPPLSKNYAKQKQIKHGARPVRDLRRTGKLWKQCRVWGATKSTVRVGWSSGYGKKIVPFLREKYEFLGLSKEDHREAVRFLQKLVNKRLGKISFTR